MTAQANTDSVPNVNPQVGEKANPIPVAAEPETQSNPNAEQPEMDKKIETAEKRAHDKQTYLEKLEANLRDYDRKIGNTQNTLKDAQKTYQQTQQVEAQEQPGLNNAQQLAAQDIGISGEQFIDLLRDNPDRALAAIVEAAEKRAEQKITANMPAYLEQNRLETEVRNKLTEIRTQLGEDEFPIYLELLASYERQGFRPTPEQVYYEYQRNKPEEKKPEAQPSSEQTQPRQAQNTQPWPMAPGGSNPMQPQEGLRPQRGQRLLPKSWNI